jgi:arginyl-tRNA synthetase
VYLKQQRELADAIRAALRSLYQIDVETVVLEQPPELAFGEFATPIAFELARKLRKAPKKIAEEIVGALGAVPGFKGFEVAGAGYINARLDRGQFAQAFARSGEVPAPAEKLHALVEHTSINPNKAAHVGHLRNAILGDTFVRLLQAAGQKVDVQNYVDNTGVQVADVVVGLAHLLKKKTVSDVAALMEKLVLREEDWKRHITNEGGQRAEFLLDFDIEEEQINSEDIKPVPIDYYFWDLYARVSSWYKRPGREEERKRIRLDTLHAIEAGGDETAAIAELVSTAILRRHLETMLRLGIEYDLLPRESEILRLHFWDSAFEQLKEAGVLYPIPKDDPKNPNRGCWVMRRRKKGWTLTKPPGELLARFIHNSIIRHHPLDSPDLPVPRAIWVDDFYDSLTSRRCACTDVEICPLHRRALDDAEWRLPPELTEEFEFVEDDEKVIVRSNDTVTYVGKDIAYHLWKFGLLGKDFAYRKFFKYPDRECWISAETGEANHPQFGGAQAIYNVIDARQSDPQANVIEALRGLGYTEQAAHYTHFSYEMVALTPRCALDLGYEVSEEDQARPYIEVSGRKGFGVKADDLIDALITATRGEVDSRHPELRKRSARRRRRRSRWERCGISCCGTRGIR